MKDELCIRCHRLPISDDSDVLCVLCVAENEVVAVKEEKAKAKSEKWNKLEESYLGVFVKYAIGISFVVVAGILWWWLVIEAGVQPVQMK